MIAILVPRKPAHNPHHQTPSPFINFIKGEGEKRSLLTTRSAFTLIELMIALGLLGALMAVAWSLLGTFRDAEMRGWKVSYRTQTIRSARTWLEDDVQHLVPALSPNSFIGNSMGFSATIEPSIDPIPFLANLMSNSEPMELEPSVRDFTVGQESSVPSDHKSPWPAEAIEIEYQLTPIPTSSTTSAIRLASDSNETPFVLTRRERVASNAAGDVHPSEQYSSAQDSNGLGGHATIRSVQDLYRQTNHEAVSGGRTIRESRLEGLLKAQFRYFDGTSWKLEWNNAQQIGLPRGIAFGFDFPPTSDIQKPSNVESKNKDLNDSSTENVLVSELPLADSALATEATTESRNANQGLMESSANEVQIVIHVGHGPPRRKPVTNQGKRRDLP